MLLLKEIWQGSIGGGGATWSTCGVGWMSGTDSLWEGGPTLPEEGAGGPTLLGGA